MSSTIRAPTPYILFCNENRDKFKVLYPTATFGEQGKLLGSAWTKLSADEQQVYKDRSKAMKDAKIAAEQSNAVKMLG